jgi:formylglycine-generating enzyme required for sulfatase activity
MLRAQLLAIAAALCLCAASACAVIIDTVPVGNPGNTGEVSGSAIVGAVGDTYRIGRTEVTVAQYTEFLRAKATAHDSAQLFRNPNGITRSFQPGGWVYTIVPGWENMPINSVTFYSALRFANWMHNGQGNGDTESGAYTLVNSDPQFPNSTPLNSNSITRNPGALWFLPDENEWYKAAYYNPAAGTYFDYATASDTVPLPLPPPGNSNSAHYSNFQTIPVGGHPNSLSPYGTLDQTGNVKEWTETEAFIGRITRGGSIQDSIGLAAFNRVSSNFETDVRPDLGFRLATVPEPGSLLLTAAGLASLAIWQRRSIVGLRRR